MIEALRDFAVGRGQAWFEMVVQPHNVAAIAFLLGVLAIALWRRGWRATMTRRAVASSAASLSIFHYNFFLSALAVAGATAFNHLFAAVGLPSLPDGAWAATPVWLLIPLVVLAIDFADYWAHRLLHTTWLWPIHAVHHSDPQVNGLTSFRIHMFEGVVMLMTYTVLLSWMGLPAEIVAASAAVRLVHNIYVHVNVDWDHGPLRMVIASPRFHRWHHADDPAVYGKNLAAVFPLYDWLFGTYHAADRRCDVPVGAQDAPENDVVRLLLWPLLEWPRMILARLRLPAPVAAPVAEDKAGA